jgi:O-antigen/teichoic acid export membrane protein
VLRKFIEDMGKYAPAQFLPALTALITTPILTRLFPPSEYGYWALAMSVSAFLVALVVSGFGSAVLRFYPMYKAKSTLNVFFASLVFSNAVILVFVTGVAFLTLFLLRKNLPPLLFQLLPITILIFVTQSIFTVFISVMRAKEHSGSYTTFQLFVYYGGLGLGLLLVIVFGLRVDGLLWGSFIPLVLAMPYLIFLATKGVGIHLRNFHFSDALQMWQYAWPLTLGNVAMWALKLSDLFIIRAFRTERDVGLYSVSYSLSAKSIELLVALFMLSVSPLIYSTWESKGREATEKALTMVTRVYLILCLPAAVGLSVLARPFISLLTAPEYYEGSKIVSFVAFSSFAWGLGFIASMGMTIKKQAGRLGANMVLSAAVHIFLQFLLVPHFGYIASAISTLIGYTTFCILNTLASQPHLAWRFPMTSFRNVLVSSILMGLISYGVYEISRAGDKVSIPYLFLSILVAVSTYLSFLWWLNEIKVGEKQAFWRLWSTIKKRES